MLDPVVALLASYAYHHSVSPFHRPHIYTASLSLEEPVPVVNLSAAVFRSNGIGQEVRPETPETQYSSDMVPVRILVHKCDYSYKGTAYAF
jgi:hypothetical protein